jgi:hypothetical protein
MNNRPSATTLSQAHCDNISQSLKSSDAFQAHIANLNASKRGIPRSAETKAKIGAARKAAWDKLKAEREAKQRGIA